MVTERPSVAVVIVSYETRQLTLEAVGSTEKAAGVDVEVWVVDNSSDDGSAGAVRERHPQARVIELAENVGFGRGNNVALEQSDSPWILLLNSDAALSDRMALLRLVDALRDDVGRGVVGPRIEGPDGRLQFSIHSFPSVREEVIRGFSLHPLLPDEVRMRLLGSEFSDYDHSGPVDWLAGACLLVRREVLEDVGGFDPAIFMYGEEMEWQYRIRAAGWKIHYLASVSVVHHGRGGNATPSGWQRRAAMAGDAYTILKHRGTLYFVFFVLARSLRYLVQAGIQGIIGLLSLSRERINRSREAWLNLNAWLGALVHGGHRSPDGPSFLPPGHDRAE